MMRSLLSNLDLKTGGRMRVARGMVLVAFLCLVVQPTWSTRQTPVQRNNTSNLFEFHSGFWINLHHFLYREAQASEARKGARDVSLDEADTDELKRLSAQERSIWDQALSYYSQSVVKRDLLFDDELIETKNQLEDTEASSDLANARIPAELKIALLKAAPIYRTHWWT